MQESELRNLDGGDHDSAGLFQQRPSQGWGSFDEVTDPVYASEAFFSALIAVERWQQLPVTVAAQAVQRSAYPDAYQQHADEAKTLTAALTGRRGAALSCTVRAEDERDQKLDPTGLTPRATTLRTAMEDAWGTQSLGGFAPGGVTRAQPVGTQRGPRHRRLLRAVRQRAVAPRGLGARALARRARRPAGRRRHHLPRQDLVARRAVPRAGATTPRRTATPRTRRCATSTTSTSRSPDQPLRVRVLPTHPQ